MFDDDDDGLSGFVIVLDDSASHPKNLQFSFPNSLRYNNTNHGN